MSLPRNAFDFLESERITEYMKCFRSTFPNSSWTWHFLYVSGPWAMSWAFPQRFTSIFRRLNFFCSFAFVLFFIWPRRAARTASETNRLRWTRPSRRVLQTHPNGWTLRRLDSAHGRKIRQRTVSRWSSKAKYLYVRWRVRIRKKTWRFLLQPLLLQKISFPLDQLRSATQSRCSKLYESVSLSFEGHQPTTNEQIFTEHYQQRLKRQFDEIDAQLTVIEKEVERTKRSDIWKLLKKTSALDLL